MAINNKSYVYLSALLRAREAKMLNGEKAERILNASTFEESAKQLVDCGYPDMSGMKIKDIDECLNNRRASIFSEISLIVPDKSVVEVFQMKYDYHNAKVTIKANAMDIDRADLYSNSGRFSPERLENVIREDKYYDVPQIMGTALQEAKSYLARTGNPQHADFILDKAYFGELTIISKQLESPFIKGYVQLLIDSYNFRSAIRTLRMHKNIEFLRTALVDGGTVSTERVLIAANSGENLSSLYANTLLGKAASLAASTASGGSQTAFELACDNAVTAYLINAKLVSFGAEPVIAYLAATEGEITTVRMIMTGKLAGINQENISERLRDLYA